MNILSHYSPVLRTIALFLSGGFFFAANQAHAVETTIVTSNVLTVAGGNFNSPDDAVSAAIPIGFNFTYGGTVYTQVNMSTNGVMYFANGDREWTNTDLNLRTTQLGVYALWDDLYLGTSGGNENLSRCLYATSGSAGSRVFVMQWTNIYSFNEPYEVGTFNIVLYEGSNKIDIYYRNMIGSSSLRKYGASATIGLRVTGSYYTQYSLEAQNAPEGRLLNYTPSSGGTTPYSLATQNVTPATTAAIQTYFLTYSNGPKAPEALSALPRTPDSTSATLSWSLNASGVDPDSYAIRYSTIANMTSFTQTSSFTSANRTYVLTGLTPGTVYYWQVVSLLSGQTAVSTTSTFTQTANTAPVATNATFSTNTNQAVSGSLTATDVDNNPNTSGLIYSISTAPSSGTAVITNSATGAFTYTPALNFVGSVTFGFKAFDGGAYSNEATITVNVNSTNTAPVITSNGAGATASINVAENTTAVTTVTVSDTDTPTQTITYSKSGADAALFTLNSSSGVLTFTSAPNFEVPTDADANGIYQVTVTATDNGAPNLSDSQALSITVTNVNEMPSFAKGGNQSLANGVNTTQTVSGWATAIDDGDSTVSQTLTFNVSNDNSSIFTTAPAVSSAGTLTYRPNGLGGTATVTVSLTDDSSINSTAALTTATQTFTITVAANSAPTITRSISSVTVPEGTAASNSGTFDDVQSAAGVTLTASLGTVTPNYGAGTWSWSYTPPDGPSGPTTVTITATDNGTPNMANTATFTLSATNAAPTANAQTVSTNEDTPKAITLTATDPAGVNDTLSYSIAAQPPGAEGSVSLVGNVATFTPALNFNGSTSFTFTASDEDGGTSSAATVTVNVTQVNDTPSFTKGADQTLPFGSTAAQSITNWATAISAGAANESGQALTFNITGNTNAALFTTLPAVASNGTLTYKPTGAAGSATITLTLTDDATAGGSALTTASQSFTITVQAAPNYTVTTTGNAIVVTDVSGNSDTLTVSEPSAGNIQFGASGRTFAVDGGLATSDNSAVLARAGATSITVNAGAGADVVNMGAFTGTLPSLTINGGTDDDTVNFTGDITFAANANLDVNLQNDDATPGVDAVTLAANANLLTSGTGTISVKASKTVQLNSGSSLETVNGGITVEANQQAVPTATSNAVYGVVLLFNSAIKSSGSGSIAVAGRGRDSGQSLGVRLDVGTQIVGGTSGTVSVQGTGGGSNLNGNTGVSLYGAATTITSLGANVQVTGIGGGSGSGPSNYGVSLLTGATITAGGAGTVTVQGTGGMTTGNNNYGVYLSDNVSITSGGGNVQVTGIEGTGSNSLGINLETLTSITTAANGGTLTLAGNSMALATGTVVAAGGSSSVTLKPYTAGTAITLGTGTDTVGGPLTLSDAELDTVTAGTINIGDNASGAITVNAAITRAAATALSLTSSANIDFTTGSLSSAGGNVTLKPGTNVFASTSGVDVTTSATSTLGFLSGSNLKVAVTNATADSGYTQLNVAGKVDLTGVNLSLSGAHVPTAGQAFTIVNNDGTDAITGTFNGLAEGAIVNLNSVPLAISYVGGSGNDVVLSYARPVIARDNATVTVNEGSLAGNTGTFSDLQGNGTVNLTASVGTVTPNNGAGTWSWSYTPADGPANPTVTITATDSGSLVATTTFSLTVNNVAPTATPQTVTTNEDTPKAITLTATDPAGINDTLSYSIAAQPPGAEGSVSLVGNVATFTPALNFNGSTSFTFTASDEDGGTSSAATVTVNVTQVNDTPAFTKGADQTLPFGSTAAQSITNWATAISAGAANESGQALTFNITGNTNAALFTTLPAVASNGTLTYKPTGAAGTATISVTLTDDATAGGAALTSAAQSFVITVQAQSDYTVTTTGNAIVVTDISGNGDTLALSEPSAGNIQFAASGRTFAVDGGFSIAGNSGNISRGGANSITVNAGAGANTINVSAFTGTLPSLTINGGTGDDTVNLNGDITFAADASLDIDLQNDDAAPGVDSVNVASNTNIATSGAGSITVKVSRNIAFNTGSSFDTVNGSLTLQANQQATPTSGSFNGISLIGAGTIVRSTGTGVVRVTGTGGNSGLFQNGVNITNGARISGGTAGTMTVTGTGGASASNANMGVWLEHANSQITSAGANVSVIATGGGSGATASNCGLYMAGTAVLTAGGSGTVSVTGMGGLTSGGADHGISINEANTQITSNGGNVSISGTGGGTGGGHANNGVDVSGATLTAGGTGTVTVNGTGGNNAGSNNQGVQMTGGKITSSGGNVSVLGTSLGSGSNSGVNMQDAEISSTGAGTLTVNGAASAASSFSAGVWMRHASGTVGPALTSTGGAISITASRGLNSYAFLMESYATVSGGPISIAADQVSIFSGTNPATINAGSGTVTLRQKTNGCAIGLGDEDATSLLGLTDAELDRINCLSLVIGDANSGAITQNAAINRVAATNMTLNSGSSIAINTGSLDTSGGSLTVNPGGASNTFTPAAAGADVSLGVNGTLSFGSGDKLAIAISGATADSGYTQLKVAGKVDLTGAELQLSGAYVPAGGNSFVLIDNDGTDAITGTFNGLAEGAIVSLNSVPLAISYVGGSGNDVVLSYARPVIARDNATVTVNEGSLAGNTGTFSDLQGNGTANLTASVGTVTPNNGAGTWSWSYTPADGPDATQTVTITATDGGSLTATTTFSLVVTNVAPTAVAQSVTTNEDTPKLITLAATDPGADSLTYSIVTGPSGAQGTLSAVVGNQVTFTPAANYNGSASFTFKATDSDGADSNVATVSITVDAVNDQPVVARTNATATVNEGSVAGNTGTFSDVDGNGTVSLTASVGTITPNAGAGTWSWSYTPADGPDATQTVTITATDNGNPILSSSTTFSLVVNNVAPTALAQSVSTNEDTPKVITLAATDPGADTQTYSIVTGPTGAQGSLSAVVGNQVTFTPAANYNGSASFTFKATDSDGAESNTAMVSITVDAVNDQPVVARTNATVTVNEGSLASNAGTFSDADGNGTVSLTASIGTITPNAGAGTWSWSYTPADGPDDTKTVTITATDDGEPALVSTVTFALTVNNVAPTAVAQSLHTDEDAAKLVTLTATDPGTDTQTFSIVTAPPANEGTLSVISGNEVTFTPALNFNGNTSFTFKATDSDGAEGSTATITIAVDAVNDQPVVARNNATVGVNEGSTASNAGTFADADGNSTVSLTASIGTITPNFGAGTWSWSYTPADGPDASQTVTITATDDGDPELVSTTTFALTVNNVAPTIALSGDASANQSGVYTLNLGAISDPGTDTVTGYSIDWGDGTTEDFTGNPTNGSKTHTYNAAGNVAISISLTDEDGTYANAGSAMPLLVKSNNAKLSNLALSDGTLTPGFDGATTSYATLVANTTTTLSVTPVAADSMATVQASVNGGGYTAVSSGGASAPLALNAGHNTVRVKVVAEDGITTTIYTIAATRTELPSLVVTTAADVTDQDGLTSLREALNYALGNPVGGGIIGGGVSGLNLPGPGSDSLKAISFDPQVFATPQVITLSSALPDLTTTLSITGPAAGVTISGGNTVRIFNITAGAAVTLNNLTLRNGFASDADGGAIRTEAATVTLNGCTLSSNTARHGGAIYNLPASGLTSSLTLNRCTLNANTAVFNGGAVYTGGVQGTATTTLVNCTIAGNTSDTGTLFNYGELGASTTTTRFCTISGNTSSVGAGVYNFLNGAGSATFVTSNTIFSNAVNNIAHTGSCTFTSNGNNLCSDAAEGDAATTPGGVLNAVGDRRNTDPKLGTLGNQGGLQQTVPLLAGSPAIDAGNNAGAPPTDGRNFSRPVNNKVDIGAFEFGGVAAPFGVFETVTAFANTGAGPRGPIARDPEGAIWGTTATGGLAGQGTIWKFDAGGAFATIAELGGAAVGNAKKGGGLRAGSDGNFYVTTTGDTSGVGTVLRMSPDGALTTVQASTGAYTAPQMLLGSDGFLYGGIKGSLVKIAPTGGVVWSVKLPANTDLRYPLLEWLDGNFYGTSILGGTSNLGVAFKLTRTGVYTVVKSFIGGAAGSKPSGSLITGPDGAMYGVTSAGGANNAGTVFRLTNSGNHRVVASFPTGQGNPGNIVYCTNGCYYGTRLSGTFGGIYKMTADGTISSVVAFTGTGGSAPGTMTADTVESLIWGQNGVLYGATAQGGAANGGVLYSIAPDTGAYTVLRQMSVGLNDPQGALAEDNAGNHYGVNRTGGSAGKGTIFKVTSTGQLMDVYAFTGPDGSLPQGGLTAAADGNYYGTTSTGGAAGLGTLFRMSPNGTVTVLFSFTGNSGMYRGATPLAPLTAGPDGSLYGTTSAGGSSGLGTVFRLTNLGGTPTYTVLANFAGKNGSGPVGGVTMDTDGKLWGTTRAGGASSRGCIFKITGPATESPVLAVVTSFSGTNGAAPGNSPQTGLIRGNDGKFYGSTRQGGTADAGTVFRVSSGGAFELVTSFTNASGAAIGKQPEGLAQGPDGRIYGVTAAGGASGNGVLFAIDPVTKAYSVRKQFEGDVLGRLGRGVPLMGRDGNLYGLTATTVWRMTFVPQPTAKTRLATAVTSTSATLNGTVNANGMNAVVQFQLGDDGGYNTTLTAVSAPPSGTGDTAVTLPLYGLLPHAVYHYRVVATAGAYTVYGADQTLTTLNSAPEAGSDSVVTSSEIQLAPDPLPDAEGDSLWIYSVAAPSAGTIRSSEGAGVFYTPGADLAARGYDQFIYQTSDGTDVSAPALLTIRYQPLTGSPAALPADAVVLPTINEAYAAWAAAAIPASVTGDKRLPYGDADADGIVNVQECLMGLNPAKKDTSTFVVDVSGRPAFTKVRYSRQKGLMEGFETLEESVDGVTWTAVNRSRTLVKRTASTTTDTVEITVYPMPGTTETHQFRVAVNP